MVQVAIIIEDAGENYSAFSPDVPGCVSTGKTIEETKTNMEEALRAHFACMREDEKQEILMNIGKTYITQVEVA